VKITETRRKKGIRYSAVIYLGRDSAGKRIQRRLTADTKRQLNRLIEDTKSEARQGNIRPSGKDSVERYLEMWLKSAALRLEHRTLASYTDIVDAYLKPTLGRIPLRSLAVSDVERAMETWLRMPRRDVPKIRAVRRGRGSNREVRYEADAYGQRLRAETERELKQRIEFVRGLHRAPQGLSAQTIRYILTVLRMALNDAVKRRYVSFNPAQAVRGPRVSAARSSVLSAAEFAELLLIAEVQRGLRMRVALLTAAGTGIRRGELCALQWGDLDLGNRTLTARRAVEVRRAIRNRVVTERLAIKGPKGEREDVTEYTIAIPPIVCEELLNWQRQQSRRLGRVSPRTPVFDAAGSVWHPDSFGKEVHKLIMESGLPRVRLHDLRHSYGSWLANENVSARVIQAQLRHRTASMTNRYTKHVEAAQVEAAERLDQRLRAAIGRAEVDTKLTLATKGTLGQTKRERRKPQ
jgi:integrase